MLIGKRWGTFAMITLPVVAASIAVVVTVRLPAQIVERSLQTDIERRATIWLERILDEFGGPDGFAEGRVLPEQAEFLRLLLETSDTYKIKLYTSEGVVFWSSRPSEIGDKTTNIHFQDVVGTGQFYFDHITKPLSELGDYVARVHDGQSPVERSVAEIYVPVLGPEGFVGVAEFYVDETEQFSVLTTRLRVVVVAIAGIALLALGTISFLLMWTGQKSQAVLTNQAGTDRRLMEEQVRLTREVRLLGELNEWLQSASSLEELFEMMARFLSQILPECAGSIYVSSNIRDMLDARVFWNGGMIRPHIRREECWGLRRGRTYTYLPNEINFSCSHTSHDDKPYFCFPIIAHGEAVGLMHLEAIDGEDIRGFRDLQRLAQMCAEQVSIAIANVRMRDQLQELSIRDPLTGLHNRRHFHDVLRRMEQDHRLAGTEFGILCLDVDHFKSFNDRYGHDAGDKVLCSVATMLGSVCRKDEIICRVGGEEFSVLMPDADLSKAEGRAERIRTAVEELRIRHGEQIMPPITVSVGVAAYPLDGLRPDDLLRSADEALYAAKDAGRNLIRTARRLNTSKSSDIGKRTDDVVPLSRKVPIQTSLQADEGLESGSLPIAATVDPSQAEQAARPGKTGVAE